MFLFRLVFSYEIALHDEGPYSWTGFYMIGTSVMKELTTLSNKFTESEVKKESKFSLSRNFDFTCLHFNIYEYLKWLEKQIWLINTCDITDMFKNTEAGVPRWSVKMVFLTVSQNSQESIYVGVSY